MGIFTRLFGSDIPQVNATQAKERLQKHPKPFLLDVRQPDEYQSGHIAGAKLIPLGELSRRLKEIPSDREILCICRSGNRSSSAVRQLHAAGYRAVNLQGGMLSWDRAGFAIKKGTSR